MLEGKNIYLIPISNTDTDNIIRWRNQEFVRNKFIYQKMFTKESHERWMNQKVNTGKVKQFIIHVKKEEKPIGSVYLRDIDYNNAKAEYGIFIGEKEYLGKGIGTEAAKLILEYAFQSLNLHKVMLRVLAQNKRAIASYMKAGFKEEGCFKDDIKIENTYYDVIFMAAINKYENID